MSDSSKRLFEAEEQCGLYAVARPTVPNNVIQTIIDYAKQQQRSSEEAKLSLALDVACGSGQSCLPLSPWFEKVLGFDISPGQIKEANSLEHPDNITYQVGSAESLPVPDQSVDLIFCNMAIHWFNRDVFFTEVQRVLKVGGVLAVSAFPGFGNEIPLNVDPIKSDRFVAAQNKFVEDMKDYTDPALELYARKYKDIHPLPGLKNTQYISDLVGQRSNSARNQVENHLSSSAYQTMREKNPDLAKKVVDEFMAEAKDCFGSLDAQFSSQFDIVLLLGAKL